jgi:alpha-tubulin suppressor-like RCC1 family protein
LAASYYHSLALRQDGTVAAWGENYYGKCDVPAGLGNVAAIAVGMDHSLALRQDGSIVAWGDNNRGQCNVPAELR